MKAHARLGVAAWTLLVGTGCDHDADDRVASCAQHVERAACEAEPGCELFEGRELQSDGGTCGELSTDGGICHPTGALLTSSAPAEMFHVATGRVFSFASQPAVSEQGGWALCGCNGDEPDACACSPDCQPPEGSGGGSGTAP